MYIPNFQNVVAAGLALTGMGAMKSGSKIAHGSVTDFAVEKCLDLDGTKRCTTPFKVSKSTCYTIKWSTDGAISHTTAEVRDAGSNEIVYYRDTDGDWTAEKNELVYVDFKPKIIGQGNHTVDYDIRTCE